MASKNTRSAPVTSASGSALRLEVERLILRERYKDAVKQAKLCFKQEATAEHHRLLEQAYFLRACQLSQLGMPSSAVEVCHHLLDFGLTATDWVDEFIRLLMTLGLEQKAFHLQERFGNPELKNDLVAIAADDAVIHPERPERVSGEIVRDANLVRQALERLQSGDEAGAFLLVRDLPRSSPLSEWKLFVRGLAAFQNRNPREARTNWERLDPKRKAFVIAERMQHLVDENGPAENQAAIDSWETAAYGEPILARLHQVRGLAAHQQWDKVAGLLGPLQQRLKHIDPRLPERLTGVLLGGLVKESMRLPLSRASRLVGDFTRVAQPLAIDPHWNRLWAILWDGPQGQSEAAERYWLKYIDDLKTISAFSPRDAR